MRVVSQEVENRLLKAVWRAASEVPGYRALLQEQGARPEQIVDLESFRHCCPVLARADTFDRFPLDQLCAGGELGDLAGVLTSSGHGGGGRFSFGLIDRNQAALSEGFIDLAFDNAFQVKAKKTLVINCLPMGVVFSSRCMTVATTSVREDMAIALIQAFAKYYEQVVLVGDPLFMKRLTDFAAEKGVDWSQYKINAILGEEIFGENYRGYMAARLQLGEGCWIMGSFGVAELGLHLCFETLATVALRREASRNRDLSRDLFGLEQDTLSLPMLYSYNPYRTHIEVLEEDATGYGKMTVSMLDPELLLPLIRYQTGDVVRLLDPEKAAQIARRYGIELPENLPQALLALKGRSKEELPNGSHVGIYKDALYSDHVAARKITGAFRLVFSGGECAMHVQLNDKDSPPEGLAERMLQAFPPDLLKLENLVLWSYDRFPFGMGLDYERKFTYFGV